MEELAYGFEEDSIDIYSDIVPMLPEGESYVAYRDRVGDKRAAVDYSYALALYREHLAQSRGITLEQLHDDYQGTSV